MPADVPYVDPLLAQAEPRDPRRLLRPAVALAVVVALGVLTRLPSYPDDPARLTRRFAFDRHELGRATGRQTARAVAPAYSHIAGWISSVGASVALADVDGDGLPNDVCLVDPRRDEVLIQPAPGDEGPARYAAFVLPPPARVACDIAPMGCLPADCNADGLLDVVVYYWGRPPVVYLRRDVDGPLTAASFRAQPLGPPGAIWNTNAMTQADVDGDGRVDLVVGNYFPDGCVLLGEGEGTTAPTMQDSMSRADNGGRNRVLLWQGGTGGDEPSVRYREVLLDGAGWTLALDAADLDDDGRAELYVANDFGPDELLHNRSRPGAVSLERLLGARGPATPWSKVLGRDSFKGMGVEFVDLDRDGRLDILVSNLAVEFGLMESHFAFIQQPDAKAAMARGVAPFVDRSEALGLARGGWGWDVRTGDFDNDGRLEVVRATGFLRGRHDRWPELHEVAMGNDQLLKRAALWHRFGPEDDLSGRDPDAFHVVGTDLRWHDVAAAVGVGEPRISRGVATADVDGDGALDLALACQWSRSLLLRNRGARGNFLGLHLRLDPDGTQASADFRRGHPTRRTLAAVGARVLVSAANGLRLVGRVDGGGGHSGVRSPSVHFGLGRTTGACQVEIFYRALDGGRRRQTLTLKPGWHTVVLGSR